MTRFAGLIGQRPPDEFPPPINSAVCPKCQSAMIYTNSDGDRECVACGRVWTPERRWRE